MTFTTVSFTPCWRRLSGFSAGLLRVLLVGSMLATGAAGAEGIIVKSATLEPIEDTYQLSVTFELEFSQTIEDAINRGLSLPFIIEYEITRPRWYWLDETVAKGSRSRQISYNALTRQYRLTIVSGDTKEKYRSLYQNFDRLEDTKLVLSSVRGWDIMEHSRLNNGTTYEVAVRMRLDVSRLPKPFQVNALASRDWNLASDWFRFDYTP